MSSAMLLSVRVAALAGIWTPYLSHYHRQQPTAVLLRPTPMSANVSTVFQSMTDASTDEPDPTMDPMDPDATEQQSWLELFSSSYRPLHVPLVMAICLFGAAANIANVVILTRPALLKNPTNTILLGLSIAQLLLLVNFLCYTAYSQVFDSECNYSSKTYSWLAVLLMNVNLTVVLHSIALVHTVMLGMARYVIIHFVGKRWVTVRRAAYTCLAVFAGMPLFGGSFYFNSEIAVKDMSDCADYQPNRTAYRLTFVDNRVLKSYNFWIFSVFCKLLPCLCLVVASCLIIRDIRQARKRHERLCGPRLAVGNAVAQRTTTQRSANKPQQLAAQQQQSVRTTQLLLAIVCLFVVVELPQGICNLVIALQMSGIIGDTLNMRDVLYNLGDFFEMLTVLYSAINFVLYCVMSTQFRAAFYDTFVCALVARRIESRRGAAGGGAPTPAVGGPGQHQQRKIVFNRSAEPDNLRSTALTTPLVPTVTPSPPSLPPQQRSIPDNAQPPRAETARNLLDDDDDDHNHDYKDEESPRTEMSCNGNGGGGGPILVSPPPPKDATGIATCHIVWRRDVETSDDDCTIPLVLNGTAVDNDNAAPFNITIHLDSDSTPLCDEFL